MTPMMKCGHAANAVNIHKKPVCAICIGINAGAEEVEPNPPSLAGRTARCTYCKRTKPSDTGLPFFERRESEFDSYYCGCRGWD